MTLPSKSDGDKFHASEYNELRLRGAASKAYHAVVYKEGGLVIADGHDGARISSATAGSTGDATVIQAAITGAEAAGGGDILFGPGVYTITTDITYALNSRTGGSIGLKGVGGRFNENDPANTQGGTTLYFNEASLLDGRFADWNTGYTEIVAEDIALVFRGNSATGKGKWDGALTQPTFRNVGLGVYGTYADNATALFGRASGPIGRTALFEGVNVWYAWTDGDFVTGMRLHFDTFTWDGGSIGSDFPTTGVTQPRYCYFDMVYSYDINNISHYRTGDWQAIPPTGDFGLVSIEFFLLNLSDDSVGKAGLFMRNCYWQGPARLRYFTNAGSNAINVYLVNTAFGASMVTSGTPAPTLVAFTERQFTDTLAAASIPYTDANGRLTDALNLFWDAANARLGIGTSSPSASVHSTSEIRSDTRVRARNANPRYILESTDANIASRIMDLRARTGDGKALLRFFKELKGTDPTLPFINVGPDGEVYFAPPGAEDLPDEKFDFQGTVHVRNHAWDQNLLRLGAYRIWVDSTGDLRIKNGAPANDTDGTVVGTQT